MPTSDKHQLVLLRRLERILIAFFVLAALSLLVVYFADPSIYTSTLLLEPSATDRYPLPATLFLVGILIFIAVLIVGVTRHWRWLQYGTVFIGWGWLLLRESLLFGWYRSFDNMEPGQWGRRKQV